MRAKYKLVLVGTIIILLALVLIHRGNFGIGYVASSANSNVSTETASIEGAVFHPDPCVVIQIEAGTIDEDILRGGIEEAIFEISQLTSVEADQTDKDTPVLHIQVDRTDGFFTPLFSRNQLFVQWHYASDANIDGLLRGETIVFEEENDLIRRISGKTEIQFTSYGLYSRINHSQRLAQQLGAEVATHLVP